MSQPDVENRLTAVSPLNPLLADLRDHTVATVATVASAVANAPDGVNTHKIDSSRDVGDESEDALPIKVAVADTGFLYLTTWGWLVPRGSRRGRLILE